MPSTMPRLPVTLLLPPPTPLALLWNSNGGSMAARRGAPSLPNRSTGSEIWPSGFAYDIDVSLPLPPPLSGPRSYADVTANHHQGQCRNVLPPGHAVEAGFVSSSNEEGAILRL